MSAGRKHAMQLPEGRRTLEYTMELLSISTITSGKYLMRTSM
jgi:hypothetical protein